MKIAVLGLGQRGSEYIRIIKMLHKDIEVVAVCDCNKIRADQIAEKHKIPARYYCAEELFAAGKIADALIISTQDRDHYPHAMAAIATGYDKLLIEKPVSPVVEQCRELAEIAKEKKIVIVVCHVLRYSKYYAKIKQLISDGVIGDVMTINHTENVAYFHYAHSYVRGCWHDSNETSPLLLAKCCHDFDLLHWFMDKPCVSVSSYGALTHFTAANAPAGSTEKCIDCKVKCPYNAQQLYLKDTILDGTFTRYMGRVFTGKAGSTRAEKQQALADTPYGTCVYRCNNNVADHQIVNMLFEGGATASHTVTAFSKGFFRRTQVSGTKGEIIADDLSGKIRVNLYKGKCRTINTKLIKGLGHVDGDINMIKDWCLLIQGKLEDDGNVTYIQDTVASHEIVMSAEQSRLNEGAPVKLHA